MGAKSQFTTRSSQKKNNHQKLNTVLNESCSDRQGAISGDAPITRLNQDSQRMRPNLEDSKTFLPDLEDS